MSTYIQAMGTNYIRFELFGLPPRKKVYIFCNQYNVTSLAGTEWDPYGEGALNFQAGTEIITDENGYAAGAVFLMSNPVVVIPIGDVTLTFVDNPTSVESSTFIAESNFVALGEILENSVPNVIEYVRPSLKLRKSNSGEIKDSDPNDRQYLSRENTLDPLSQTFFVDPIRYPLGIALTSLDLFFVSKDDSAPISIELRPVKNGVPSTSEVIAGSYVFKKAADVNIPSNILSALETPTTFTFKHPIFLNPGEYAFCILSNAKNYVLYSGKYNKPILGNSSNYLVNKQPFVGALYKTQNTSVWTSDKNESLCFVLRKAKFETGLTNVSLQNPTVTILEFDQLKVNTADLSFGEVSTINYKLLTTTTSGTVVPYQNILTNRQIPLSNRSKANVAGDAKILIELSNKSKDVSPVVDRERLYISSDKYYVDSVLNRSLIRVDEVNNSTSSARARYITKVVTLPVAFESTGLQVDLEVNRKTGTDIDIFYKTMSPLDSAYDSDIDDLPWARMEIFNDQPRYAGLSEDLYFTESYRQFDITYSRNSVVFNSFTKYQIKIIFYSDSPTIIPKIKNLVITSVI